MADREEIGLDAVWGMTDFNKNQTEYIKRITGATGTTIANAQKMGLSFDMIANRWRAANGQFASTQQIREALGDTAKKAGEVSPASELAAGSVLKLGAAFGAGFTLAKKFVDKVIESGTSIYKFAESSLFAASRVQQLNYIAQTLGNSAGYTSEEINGFVDSVKEAGISASESNNLIAQFLRANLDLTKSTQLAKVAQDAATLAGEGSSDALGGIIHGITTLSPLVLRHHGILVDLESAYSKYATEMGIAGRELTTVEKQQAALNAVLAAGDNIAGAYNASMATAGKQFGSLKSRLIPDLQAAFGGPLQNAFYNAITGINGVIKGITAMISEGGVLYPVLINVGGALAYLTEPLKAIGDFMGSDEFMGALSEWVNNVQSTIMNMINNAYSWGVGLAAEFANGIIEGARSLIQKAINWVRNLIRNWFAPHSPPKVASAIDKYGMGTINEWLTGMTKGDYSILEGIEGPLEKAMRAMVNAGDIGEEEAFRRMQDIQAKMLQALSGGETLGDDFFSSLAASAGQYGDAIADLARKQYELQLAEDGVAQAEKELEDARKRGAEAGKQVTDLTQEYNRMLTSGASKEQLAAKKAELDAARAAQSQATKDEEAAKGKVDAAKENVELLKEQLDLQKKLVDQLLKMAEVMKGEEVTEPGGGGAGELPEPDTGGGGGGGGLDDFIPVDELKAKVEEAKTAIAAKMQELWDQLKTMATGGIQNLGEIWESLVGLVTRIWDRIADKFGLPSWDEIKAMWVAATTWIAAQVQWLVEVIKKWWKDHGDSVKGTLKGFWDFVKNGFMNFLKNIGDSIRFWIAVFHGFWVNHGSLISAAWRQIWENIKKGFENDLEIIGNIFDIFSAAFKGDWQTVWNEVKDIFALVWENIKLSFEIWKIIFQTTVYIFLNEIKTTFETIWESIRVKLSEVWENIKANLFQATIIISLWIAAKLLEIQSKWNEIWTAIQAKLTEIMTAIDTYLRDLVASLFEKLGLDLDEMKAKWSQIWDDAKFIIETIWNKISEYLAEKSKEIKQDIADKLDTIKKNWDEVWGNIKKFVTDTWDTMKENVTQAIKDVSDSLSDSTEGIRTDWQEKWDEVSQKFSEIWNKIIEDIKGFLFGEDGLVPNIMGAIDGILGDLAAYVDKFKSAGGALIDGMKEGVLGAVGGLIKAVTQAIADALAAARNKLAGADTSASGQSTGFSSLYDDTANSVAAAAAAASSGSSQPYRYPMPALQPAAIPISAGNTYNRSLEMNMYNSVSDVMTMAKLQAVIVQTINQQLRK